MCIFRFSTALQQVLELELRTAGIDSYSGVGIVGRDRACLVMARLVMAIFGSSATLQQV